MSGSFVSTLGGVGGVERSRLETIDVLEKRGVYCPSVVPQRSYLSAELRNEANTRYDHSNPARRSGALSVGIRRR